ncbi:BTB domain-containing protein [Mycena venus]|uniref:BTB domain-containing protein n=1 Tax=Mycena venus TaxID=2733690 RepID=A0A8H7D521_9AGAR|nr:BTB domain-containing protein [Mycena venus]
MAEPRVSERFCASDADITISSADGVLFKIHRKNLEVHSDVFANAENATRPENGAEIVHLTENSNVLDLLFQYMYRQPQPDLNGVEFATVADLAEAAEKYVVYSALGWCRMKMKQSVTTHPLEVLRYAARHGLGDLANESAQRSTGCRVSEALDTLPPDIFKTWILFYERWHQEKLKFLADMTNYPGDIALLGKCLVEPNPFSKFRQELQKTGYRDIFKEMMDIKFMSEGGEAK